MSIAASEVARVIDALIALDKLSKLSAMTKERKYSFICTYDSFVDDVRILEQANMPGKEVKALITNFNVNLKKIRDEYMQEHIHTVVMINQAKKELGTYEAEEITKLCPRPPRFGGRKQSKYNKTQRKHKGLVVYSKNNEFYVRKKQPNGKFRYTKVKL